jgi:hypothetical protein
VILALLAFTVIYTSPLTAGLESGSALSKSTPKQRNLLVQEIAWELPLLQHFPWVQVSREVVALPAEPVLVRTRRAGRFCNRPPPIA